MNSAHLNRQFTLLQATSLNDAIVQARQKIKLTDLTCIDMSRDFNQNKWLGQELCDTLIYFNEASKINGLLAVLGCVKAPYNLILAYDNKNINDYFKLHILIPKLIELSRKTAVSINDVEEKSNDHEITKALLALKFSNSITHLVGERGSGKSTLLGLYLADYILSGKQSAVLSSPIHAASKNTISAYRDKIKHTKVSRETFIYCPPQELLGNLSKANCIIIDEAATYPRNILNKTLQHANENAKTLILSTTIEGYEGTGQSYRLNYLAHKQAQHTIIIDLTTPKRFSLHDPIHSLCKAIYNPSTKISHNKNYDGTYLLTTQALREKGWTSACFALLKSAHYKTTPNDLARFYNDEALFIVKVVNGEVIAAIYALTEILPSEIDIESIFNGERRAKNAFTQQAIISAYGEFSMLNNKNMSYFRNSKILRISRIAIHKNHRRQKIATYLIDQLKQIAEKDNYDFLSTSFSGSTSNMAFWQSQNFLPARIGLYPNKSNDEFAVLMLNGLNETAIGISEQCHWLCSRHIRYFSADYLPHHHDLLDEVIQKSQKSSSKSIINKEINGITNHHRDINWALPMLAQYPPMQKTPFCRLIDQGLRNKSTKAADIRLLKQLKIESEA